MSSKFRFLKLLQDPGFEVDLYLACSLPDMIRVVRGDLPLSRALSSERLEVLGTASARRQLAAWLNLSPITRIKSQRAGTGDRQAGAVAR